LNEDEEMWELHQDSRVDVKNQKVLGYLGEFGSTYCIMGFQKTSTLVYDFSFYPNPLNPGDIGNFVYLLTDNAMVIINIFTATGGLVKQIEIEPGDPTGGHGIASGRWNEVHWDGTNDAGRWLANGAYFAHFEATAFHSGAHTTKTLWIGITH